MFFGKKLSHIYKKHLIMRFPDPRFMARTHGSFMQREKLDR